MGCDYALKKIDVASRGRCEVPIPLGVSPFRLSVFPYSRMDPIIEFAENYEPSRFEILSQADRRLRFHDRSNPNSRIGLTRVPFDDGTSMDVEFYKQREYEHNGILYSVLLSIVLRESQAGPGETNLTVYLILRDPNTEEMFDSYFTITNYGEDNEAVGELTFMQLDEFVDNHSNAYEIFNFLYGYGEDGVVIKDDGGRILDMRYWIPQNENQVQNVVLND